MDMSKKRAVPFRFEEELNSELQLDDEATKSTAHLRRTQRGSPATLPGNAFVDLNLESICAYLEATLLTTKLNTLAPRLWLMATASNASISPLHKQRILGRDIVVTDTADLHLIWYHSKIFIKPLPRYLTSHAFWRFIFNGGHAKELAIFGQLHGAALGFIRTYCHLIRSETDFQLALSHNLIPEGVEFEAFARFIKCFRDVPDIQTSPRFHFGELRLSRLNFWSAIFLRQMHYFNMSRQYGTYFSRYFQPLLFTFGMLSVLLSAMQVALAAEEQYSAVEYGWSKFVSVSKWTSIATILIVLLSVVWLLAVLVYKLLSELIYALESMLKRRLNTSKYVV